MMNIEENTVTCCCARLVVNISTLRQIRTLVTEGVHFYSNCNFIRKYVLPCNGNLQSFLMHHISVTIIFHLIKWSFGKIDKIGISTLDFIVFRTRVIAMITKDRFLFMAGVYFYSNCNIMRNYVLTCYRCLYCFLKYLFLDTIQVH